MCSAYYPSSFDLYPNVLRKAEAIVSKEMIASGWNPKAGKFMEVHQRKSRQLFLKMI